MAVGGTCDDSSDRKRAEPADGTGTQDRMRGHYSQSSLPKRPVGTVRWSPLPIGSDELTVAHSRCSSLAAMMSLPPFCCLWLLAGKCASASHSPPVLIRNRHRAAWGEQCPPTSRELVLMAAPEPPTGRGAPGWGSIPPLSPSLADQAGGSCRQTVLWGIRGRSN